MSENKKVFITPKGRKYHFYTSCNYIKGRQYQKISFAQAKKLTKGPCSSCQHLLEKNGDKFDDESVEKEEEKEKEENNKINININKEINNKNKISKKSNNKKKEEFKENNISSSSSFLLLLLLISNLFLLLISILSFNMSISALEFSL